MTGCGTPSPDLFVVQRFGEGAGARLRLLVSDTTVRCNDQARRDLSSKQILEARDIADKLIEFQQDDDAPAVPRRGQIFTFSVRGEEGTVRFGDTARRPEVLPRVARFTRSLAQDVCGLRR